MRTGLSIGIILMVISEMFASRNGIGFAIIQFQRTFALPEMWSGILLLGIIGVALSLLMRGFERLALHWYEGVRQQG
jgi:ABC-type nitrate/sulfonate/bicarbonate transport system permease component